MLNKWIFLKIPIYFLENSASINAKLTFKFAYMVRLNEGTLNGNPACGVPTFTLIYSIEKRWRFILHIFFFTLKLSICKTF